MTSSSEFIANMAVENAELRNELAKLNRELEEEKCRTRSKHKEYADKLAAQYGRKEQLAHACAYEYAYGFYSNRLDKAISAIREAIGAYRSCKRGLFGYPRNLSAMNDELIAKLSAVEEENRKLGRKLVRVSDDSKIWYVRQWCFNIAYAFLVPGRQAEFAAAAWKAWDIAIMNPWRLIDAETLEMVKNEDINQ